jgi:hypothetical protein
MSCKNTNKKTPKTGFNLNSISSVLNLILSAFSIPDEPVAPLPPPLIITGAKLRVGLSAQTIAARIISRQSEAGRPVGDIFTDGPNVEEAMELIRIEEIVNSLQLEAVVNVVIPPGVQVTTIGVGNLGAPVISKGATTGMSIGDGIIR